MKKTALLITALFGASLANAHNVWLEPVKDVKGQYVVKFGHEETETYPQSKLKAVRLLASKGQLQHWDAQANKSHNMDYELIPQSEPKAGQPLDILVLVKGKPVQGIKVGLGEDHPFNLTNEKGIAQFTPKAGYNKVWAEFDEPVKDNPDYNKRSVEYMLTFDAK